jgi:hypothetical protein
VLGAFRGEGGGSGGGSQLELAPLDQDAIAGICELYEPEGWAREELQEIVVTSGGVPLLVHEGAADLARRRTTQQVERAAEQVAATRGRLDASRGELAQGVEGIQRLVEERRRQLGGREAPAPSGRTTQETCPYKGLARFEQADAGNFFGRERLVAELVARVAEAGFLAVVGPSGSGKSSLVRAGLLPTVAAGVLDDGTQPVTVVLSPGRHPADALAARLREVGAGPDLDGRPSGGRLVVFVDQFEETFTVSDPGQVPVFLDGVERLARRQGVSVVVAVRADQFGRFAGHAGLAALLDGNDVLVGPMSDAELRRTIEMPAQQAGLTVEPGLVDLVVGELSGRVGALPLLSTALAETWDRREGRALTLAGLRAAGGVRGAVARLAEDAYLAIPSSARPAGRRLLLRLCDARDDGTLDLRRRLSMGELVEPDDLDDQTALRVLAERRLLSVDGDAVEIAHEAVLREWPRLRAWLEDDVQGRLLHRRLGDAAHAWDNAGRDPSDLLRGARLEGAVEWAGEHATSLNSLERAYLATSRTEAERELAESERRAAERLAANRRLRRMLVGAAALLVVALAAGTMALVQRGHASDARAVAEDRTMELTLQNLVSQSRLLRDSQRDLAALLALAAHDLDARADNYGALLGTFTAAPSLLATTRFPAPDAGLGVVLAGDDRFAVADPTMAVTVVRRGTGEVLHSFPPLLHPDAEGKGYLAGYPDGRAVAVTSATTTSSTSELRAYDLGTGEERFAPVRVDFLIGAVAVGPGDRIAVSGGRDGKVELRSGVDGSLVAEVAVPDRPAGSQTQFNSAALTFLPDGSLAVGTMAGSILVIDPADGRELRRVDGPVEAANFQLAASPDGSLLFGIGPRGVAGWDLATGALRWLTTGRHHCNALVVVERLGKVLCGVPDGGVGSFDMVTGGREEMPIEFQGNTGNLAILEDHRTLLQFGAGAVAEWSLDGGGAVRNTITYGPNRRVQAFLSPDTLLTNSRGDFLIDPDIVDTATGAVVDPLDGIAGAAPVADAAGVLGVVYESGASGFYDIEERAPTSGPRAGVTDDPDVPLLAPIGGISVPGGLVVWDEQHLQIVPHDAPIQRAVLVPNGVRSVLASPDGAHLYTIEEGGWLVQRDADGVPTEREPIRNVNVAAVAERVLLAAEFNGALRAFDPITMEPRRWAGAGVLSSVTAFWNTRDGSRILLGAADTRVQLVDVDAGIALGDPIDPGLAFQEGYLALTATIADDGSQLAYDTFDGAVIWQLRADVLVEAACRVAGRDITEQEWATYIGDVAPYRSLCP